MRVTGKVTSANSHGKTSTSPRIRFSDVLKDASKKDEMRDSDEQTAFQCTPPLPFHDVLFIDSGQEIGAGRDLLVTSLVQEIAVQAPPDADASVHIQFDSRTLEGLHVQIQKTGDALQVRFSTASAAVSQLLADHTPGLVQALTERGYVSPIVSIERIETPTSSFSSESKRGSGSRQDRGGQGRSRR